MKIFKTTIVTLLAIFIGACTESESPAAPESQSPSADTGPVVTRVATGAHIAGANGIHFGPDGLLYIASVIGSDITVIDPETGETVKRYTAEDGVIGPDDVAFAPDGSFYWTSILTGEVAGFNSEGKKVIAARLEPGVNPITFSDDGRLFAAQCFLGDKVYELDPQGEQAPRLISDQLGPGCGLNGMDWGPDDRLYGPRWFTGEIVSFDVEDNSMRTEASGFQTPASIKFDSKGRLHVLDTGTGEVIRLDGEQREVVATLSPGLDNFAFDERDRLFVSSFADGFIKRIDEDGITELKPGGMSHPGGITVLDGNLIVADIHAIRAYDRNGNEQFVQRNVVGVGKMGGSLNLSADGEDLILVSWFDNDLRIWNPKTETVKARYTELSLPVSAIRYQGNIVVAQHGKRRVARLTEDGEETQIGSELPAPTGLVAASGNLYVSDRELGQILMIASDGKALTQPTVVADGLTTPEGFVVTPDGFIVVEAEPGRIVHVNSAGDRHVLGEVPPGSPGAPGQPPSMVFNGIAMPDLNTLFVTGETDRALYRIDL